MPVSKAIDPLCASFASVTAKCDEKRALQALAKRVGEWPLLLKLVNGVLRDRTRGGEPFSVALAFVNEAFDEEGLIVFDDESAYDPSLDCRQDDRNRPSISYQNGN